MEDLNSDRLQKNFARRARADRGLRWLRSCAVCSRIRPPIDLICALCWREFDREANEPNELRQSYRDFPVYSLLTWTEQNDIFVRRILNGFKGGRSARAAQVFARELAWRRQKQNFLTKPTLFIAPAPRQRPDHAETLAAAVQNEFPEAGFFELQPEGVPRGKQRLKAVSARLQIEFKPVSASSFQSEDVQPRIVFIDDVITSGATARAAFRAMNNPQRFEVWTIASRPKLASLEGVW